MIVRSAAVSNSPVRVAPSRSIVLGHVHGPNARSSNVEVSIEPDSYG